MLLCELEFGGTSLRLMMMIDVLRDRRVLHFDAPRHKMDPRTIQQPDICCWIYWSMVAGRFRKCLEYSKFESGKRSIRVSWG